MFVVFDYDGVVLNSLPAVHHALQRAYVTFGIPEPSLEDSRKWLGPSIEASVRRVRAESGLGEELQKSFESTYLANVVEVAPDRALAFGGMLDVLDDLRANNVPYALATMKSHTEMRAMSRPLPGLDRFDFVAAPESIGDDGSKKELVAMVMHYFGEKGLIQGDGFMIGDRPSDIAAGQAHGLQTIAVAWGAGSREELQASQPTHLVETVDDLRALLQLPSALQ